MAINREKNPKNWSTCRDVVYSGLHYASILDPTHTPIRLRDLGERHVARLWKLELVDNINKTMFSIYRNATTQYAVIMTACVRPMTVPPR